MRKENSEKLEVIRFYTIITLSIVLGFYIGLWLFTAKSIGTLFVLLKSDSVITVGTVSLLILKVILGPIITKIIITIGYSFAVFLE